MKPFNHFESLMHRYILKSIILYFKCNPKEKFTCRSGQCIPLGERCDKTMDCEDKSDEMNCWQIKIMEDQYIKDDAPENYTYQSKLNIDVWWNVIDIVEVNEPQVSIQSLPVRSFLPCETERRIFRREMV